MMKMMYAYRLPQLKRLAEVYLAATKTPPTKLSELISKTGNNRLILQIIAGKSVSAPNAGLATDYFIANWPADVEWPADVPWLLDKPRRERSAAE
jgi:hypothetical protein